MISKIDSPLKVAVVLIFVLFSGLFYFWISSQCPAGNEGGKMREEEMLAVHGSDFAYLSERVAKHGLRLPGKLSTVKSQITATPFLREASLPPLLEKVKHAQTLKYPERLRLQFAKGENRDIWQGSYLVDLPLSMLAYLSRVQHSNGIFGSIGEIGVHGGLFFVGLAHLAAKDEKLFACDVFDNQSKNIDGSGAGVKKYFIEHACGRFGIPESDLVLFSDSSAELTDDFAAKLKLPKFRLFSVDGGHTRGLTFNDLTVAAQNLVDGGIIVLDDVTHFAAWPGVIDGMFAWLTLYPEEFAPFFVGHNKVFICSAKHHGLYYNALKQHPFWGDKALSDDPPSNSNPNKAKASGRNFFGWGGYQFLSLRDPIDKAQMVNEWVEELRSIKVTM